jgi:hypothetical protein
MHPKGCLRPFREGAYPPFLNLSGMLFKDIKILLLYDTVFNALKGIAQ